MMTGLDLAKSLYEKGNYSCAFEYLNTSNTHYKRLGSIERIRFNKNPFHKDGIVETVCNTFNQHGNRVESVAEFVKENEIPVRICNDCSMIFPTDFTKCLKCGKPFEISEQDPEMARAQIREILNGMFLDDYYIMLLASKSVELIRECNCRLIEIHGDYGEIIFTFKKEHRFFDTEFECMFNRNYFSLNLIFYDCQEMHYHDKLLKNNSFKRMIESQERKSGFKFRNCGGGYGSNFSEFEGVISFKDEFKVFVRFDTDDDRIAVYDLDLDNMALSEECSIY